MDTRARAGKSLDLAMRFANVGVAILSSFNLTLVKVV
jgi:hypothetical protein